MEKKQTKTNTKHDLTLNKTRQNKILVDGPLIRTGGGGGGGWVINGGRDYWIDREETAISVAL